MPDWILFALAATAKLTFRVHQQRLFIHTIHLDTWQSTLTRTKQLSSAPQVNVDFLAKLPDVQILQAHINHYLHHCAPCVGHAQHAIDAPQLAHILTEHVPKLFHQLWDA